MSDQILCTDYSADEVWFTHGSVFFPITVESTVAVDPRYHLPIEGGLLFYHRLIENAFCIQTSIIYTGRCATIAPYKGLVVFDPHFQTLVIFNGNTQSTIEGCIVGYVDERSSGILDGLFAMVSRTTWGQYRCVLRARITRVLDTSPHVQMPWRPVPEFTGTCESAASIFRVNREYLDREISAFVQAFSAEGDLATQTQFVNVLMVTGPLTLYPLLVKAKAESWSVQKLQANLLHSPENLFDFVRGLRFFNLSRGWERFRSACAGATQEQPIIDMIEEFLCFINGMRALAELFDDPDRLVQEININYHS